MIISRINQGRNRLGYLMVNLIRERLQQPMNLSWLSPQHGTVSYSIPLSIFNSFLVNCSSRNRKQLWLLPLDMLQVMELQWWPAQRENESISRQSPHPTPLAYSIRSWPTTRDVTENNYCCCSLTYSKSWNLEWWPTQQENKFLSRHLPSQHRYSDIHSILLHLSWTEVYMMSPTDHMKVSPAWLFCSPPSPFPGRFASTVQCYFGVLTRNRNCQVFGHC